MVVDSQKPFPRTTAGGHTPPLARREGASRSDASCQKPEPRSVPASQTGSPASGRREVADRSTWLNFPALRVAPCFRINDRSSSLRVSPECAGKVAPAAWLNLLAGKFRKDRARERHETSCQRRQTLTTAPTRQRHHAPRRLLVRRGLPWSSTTHHGRRGSTASEVQIIVPNTQFRFPVACLRLQFRLNRSERPVAP